MNLSDISIRVLTPETDLTAFKCAEGDLNEFLLDESKCWSRNRQTHT